MPGALKVENTKTECGGPLCDTQCCGTMWHLRQSRCYVACKQQLMRWIRWGVESNRGLNYSSYIAWGRQDIPLYSIVSDTTTVYWHFTAEEQPAPLSTFIASLCAFTHAATIYYISTWQSDLPTETCQKMDQAGRLFLSQDSPIALDCLQQLWCIYI